MPGAGAALPTDRPPSAGQPPATTTTISSQHHQQWSLNIPSTLMPTTHFVACNSPQDEPSLASPRQQCHCWTTSAGLPSKGNQMNKEKDTPCSVIVPLTRVDKSKRNSKLRSSSCKICRSQSLTEDTFLEGNSIESQRSINLSMVSSICLENLRGSTDIRSGVEKIEQIGPALPCDSSEALPADSDVGSNNNLCIKCLKSCVVTNCPSSKCDDDVCTKQLSSYFRTNINFISNVGIIESILGFVTSIIATMLLGIFSTWRHSRGVGFGKTTTPSSPTIPNSTSNYCSSSKSHTRLQSISPKICSSWRTSHQFTGLVIPLSLLLSGVLLPLAAQADEGEWTHFIKHHQS